MTKIDSGSTRNDASQSDNNQKASRQKSHDNLSALPLVVALNCLEDCNLEEEALAGLARMRHVRLTQISDGSIESAIAVLLHSLTFLPRPAQRRLQPCQLILCLGSVDKCADSSLASELGLHLLHVDTSRAEEVADTVMALVLGLLRHTHSLAKKGPGGSVGGLESLCRGMRRCRGLVMGIIGGSASACALASRTLAFKMKVIYFEVEEGKDGDFHRRYNFPLSARKVENLNELLGASDVVTLHCSLTTETLQLMNADAFQHLKPGALVINTSSNHLLDDCALKQALIDGTVAGCALDGVEGPQWMEAWVREMPNVLILPRSSDYSEEVWMEIRAKAVTILRSFLLDGIVPSSAVSDEDEDERESSWQEEKADKAKNAMHHELKNTSEELPGKQMHFKTPDPRHSQRAVGGHIKGSAKKGKRRSGRRKSQKGVESLATERDANWAALQRDDASMSGSTQMLSSNSRFASPEEVRSTRVDDYPYPEECASEEQSLSFLKKKQAIDMLRDGYVIALRTKDGSGYHIARRCGPEKGWYLDTVPNVTVRDPAAQFLVVLRGKERLGLRSLAAGGKMLQANRKMELLFVSHGFDAWESWVLEGTTLDDCKLISCKMRTVSLNMAVEILAILGEEDGVARWLD